LTYMGMHLSSLLVIRPIANLIKSLNPEIANEQLRNLAVGWTTFITFFIALLVSLIFISRDKGFFNGIFKGQKASIPMAIVWGVFGFVLVLTGQVIAGLIEQLIGVKAGSDSTAALTSIAKVSPIIILSIVFIGPFLEELVFRRVIFGSLYQTTNFLIAGLVSAIVFGAIHMEFEHILIYTTTGFIFAFLYQKTKRLLTTVIAHMMLNGFVVFVQIFAKPLEEWSKNIESFIQFFL
ncbi:MAG: CPBP family intramembrane glutamic endopeptidase, partial [Kurthia sp.]